MTFMLSNKTRLQWAGSLLPAVVALCASAAPAPAPAPAAAAEYSIINLGAETGLALLNRRGQAAVADWSPGAAFNGFFDGRRLYPIGTLGGSFTVVMGLNNNGVVVGQSEGSVPRGNFKDYAFTWTAAKGMRALPGPTWAQANAINDNNQAVGHVWKGGFYSAATRWNADGTLTSLGPNLGSKAAGVAINNSGVAVGYADIQRYDDRAMVWDAKGTPTDLGLFGGSTSYADFVNAKGQVAGHFYRDGTRYGFFWRPQAGSVQIGAGGGADLHLTALNDNGELAGNRERVDSEPGAQYLPFIWSLQGGSRALPLGAAAHGEVLALNNRGAMAGSVGRAAGAPASGRAVHWSGIAAPVDLNTRLYRAPAGLVLYAARAINDNGVILAESSAGLVMLRPGREGTPAPVLGPIAGSPAGDTVALGDTRDFTVSFVDSSANEKHTASSSVGDGCPRNNPRLVESRGEGNVGLRHTFCRAGVFKVTVKVTDRAGNATEVRRTLTVTDPAVATLAGDGALAPSAAAASRYGRAPLRFAVWAPLEGATAASGLVQVSGPFHFVSDAVAQRERHGQSVRLAGSGRFNGRAGYRFAVEASPGEAGNADRLRLRISHTDAATRAEVIDFDNGAAAPAAAAASEAPQGTVVTAGQLRLAGQPAAR